MSRQPANSEIAGSSDEVIVAKQFSLAFSTGNGRCGRLRTSGWNRMARVAHLGNLNQSFRNLVALACNFLRVVQLYLLMERWKKREGTRKFLYILTLKSLRTALLLMFVRADSNLEISCFPAIFFSMVMEVPKV